MVDVDTVGTPLQQQDQDAATFLLKNEDHSRTVEAKRACSFDSSSGTNENSHHGDSEGSSEDLSNDTNNVESKPKEKKIIRTLSTQSTWSSSSGTGNSITNGDLKEQQQQQQQKEDAETLHVETQEQEKPQQEQENSKAMRNTAGVTFVHFNDIYNCDKAARFVSKVKFHQKDIAKNNRICHTIFSGDVFSPSIVSTILHGKQMIPILNALQIDVACLGNHDLDFGLEEFDNLRQECNFPWLCSNATVTTTTTTAATNNTAAGDERTNTSDSNNENDNTSSSNDTTKQFLGGCKEYVILHDENGPKILVIGLIEYEWIETLPLCGNASIHYEDYVSYCQRRVPELRQQYGPFDYVVAATHMRMYNDYRLAQECGNGQFIDMILGGHDHHYESTIKNNTLILNSGTDFRDFTLIEVDQHHPADNGNNTLETSSPIKVIKPFPPPISTKTTRIPVGNSGDDDMEDDPIVLDAVKDVQDLVMKNMNTVIGSTKVPLDTTFSNIRTKETNFSNFIASLMLQGCGCSGDGGNTPEIAIMNSGTIRSDRVFPPGPLYLRDVFDTFPMPDELCVIELTGERVLLALENGVSKYPAMEGRFPCVAGIRFQFNPELPPGSRILPDSVYVRDNNSNNNNSSNSNLGQYYEEETNPFFTVRHRDMFTPAKANDTKIADNSDTTTKTDDTNDNNSIHQCSSFEHYVPLDPTKKYKVVTKAYLAITGKDGYDEAFVGTPILQDSDLCPILPTLFRNVFTEINILKRWEGISPTVIKAANKFMKPIHAAARRQQDDDDDYSNANMAMFVDPYAIRPQVDGRITNVLDAERNVSTEQETTATTTATTDSQ